MIPKIIHYCWFGTKAIPGEYQSYIANWQKLMPEYRIVKWDETNSPMNLKYMKKAYQNKKWANLSNYVRLHAVHEIGGIYLDVDVEVVKPFDALLENKCFFGFQLGESFNVNNAIFGAECNNQFIGKLKDALLALYDGVETEYLSSPHITTYFLSQEPNLNIDNDFNNGEIKIYHKDYFYPYSWLEKFDRRCIQPETIAIHHWSGSWVQTVPKAAPSSSDWDKVKSKLISWGNRKK